MPVARITTSHWVSFKDSILEEEREVPENSLQSLCRWRLNVRSMNPSSGMFPYSC